MSENTSFPKLQSFSSMSVLKLFSIVTFLCWPIVFVPKAVAQEAKREIQAKDILALIEAGQDVVIENAIIQGELDLTTLPWEDMPGGQGSIVHIQSGIWVTDSEFKDVIVTSRERRAIPLVSTIFESPVDFTGTTFSENAGFRFAQFLGAYSSFRTAQFRQGADFTSAQFYGFANFFQAQFDIPSDNWPAAYFGNAQFFGKAKFADARFKYAFFPQAQFSNTADFDLAEFSGEAVFLEAQFSGPVEFEKAQFADTTDFNDAEFSKHVTFNGTRFLGPAQFRSADFDGEAFFQSILFNAGADFGNVRFKGLTSFLRMEASKSTLINFTNARFEDRAIFNQAKFGEVTFASQPDSKLVLGSGPDPVLLPAIFFNRADFRMAQFDRADFSEVSFEEVDFTRAIFADALNLANTTYRRLIVDDLDLEILDSTNDEVLKRLEDNFRASGQLELANRAFYQKKVLERKGKPFIIQFGELVVVDLAFGYGVRPLNVVFVSIGFILLFAIFYYRSDAVQNRTPGKESKFRWRISDIPLEFNMGEENISNQPSKTQRAWDAFVFSFSVYTKLGTGQRVARRLQRVVIFEWGLGLIMIAGFLYTLTNTVPVLQRLFSAVL